MLHPKKVFWYVAPYYSEAKDTVWRDPEMLKRYLPDEIVEKKNDSELIVYFNNGSVLEVKGADNPDSLRGPNPYVTILDEFPQMKPEVWREIIYPITVMNPEAQVWFIGTPKPQGQWAKELHEDAATKKDWYSMTLNVEDSNILDDEQIEEAKDNSPTQAAFEQEMMCKWLGEEGVVFRNVEKCVVGEPTEMEYDSRYKFQFGIDLARHVDWTVIVGVNLMNHRVEIFDRFNEIDYNLQKARIEAVLRRYGNAYCQVDETGVGEPIVTDLQDRGLNVKGIKISEPVKKNLITNLALHIEQQKVSMPNIRDLVDELKIFGYEVTKAGRIRYSAPSGKHDDCVIALALALWEIGDPIKMGQNRVQQLLDTRGEPQVIDRFE